MLITLGEGDKALKCLPQVYVTEIITRVLQGWIQDYLKEGAIISLSGGGGTGGGGRGLNSPNCVRISCSICERVKNSNICHPMHVHTCY